LFVAVAVAAPALKDRPAPPPVVGEWEAVAFTSEGPNFGASGEWADPRPRWTFTADGRWANHFPGTGRIVIDGGGRYTLDPKASAPAITLTRESGPGAGEPGGDMTGTFRVDGDALTLTLTSRSDGSVSKMTFRRAKKE
jgi:uncharacterized protein (TIGR03067 family)